VLKDTGVFQLAGLLVFRVKFLIVNYQRVWLKLFLKDAKTQLYEEFQNVSGDGTQGLYPGMWNEGVPVNRVEGRGNSARLRGGS